MGTVLNLKDDQTNKKENKSIPISKFIRVLDLTVDNDEEIKIENDTHKVWFE